MWQVWRERCAQGDGGIPEGKRPLGRLRLRWEDNIKMDPSILEKNSSRGTAVSEPDHF
jgi:hypothetical protein